MPDIITPITKKIKIVPLTDIHIGTGEEINPGEYFVFDGDLTAYFVDLGDIGSRNEQVRKILLPRIGTDEWVKKVRDNVDFKELIAKYAYGKSYLGYDTEDVHAKWGGKNSSLTVNCIHRGVKGPYIPGSSLKGCLRTALVAVGCRDKNFEMGNNYRPAEDERQAMGAWVDRHNKYSIETDPLSVLKIADSYAVNLPATVLHRVSREGMAPGKEATELQDYRECLPGLMTWMGQDAELMQKYYLAGDITIIDNVPGKSLTVEKIVGSCDAYYKMILKREQEYWRNRDFDKVEMYDAIAESVGTGEALIRIGWGSGYEALSVTGGKTPKTRALIGGFPAGWAIMRIK